MQVSKIQHIIKYIEENSDKKITALELEKISNNSYRNLQRIFKKAFNESVGTFQKRVKLENAYKKIIYSNNLINNIAIEVGFESVQSFSKAFKSKFGLTPSKAREEKINLLDTVNDVKLTTLKKISFEIVYLKTEKVYYKTILTNNYSNNDIDELWDELDTILTDKNDVKYFGTIVDEPLITSQSKCRYEACVNKEINKIDFNYKNIFGGKYAKFIHKGSYDEIEETYKKIYNDWLFNSTINFDNSPIVEFYKIHSNSEECNFITEILIPILKQ